MTVAKATFNSVCFFKFGLIVKKKIGTIKTLKLGTLKKMRDEFRDYFWGAVPWQWEHV